MHPTVKMVARFDETVNAPDMGVPTHQVKEFAPRYSFGCSISSSPYLALAMTDHPSHAPAALAAWEQCAIYYAMTGGGAGRVRPVPAFADPLVHYQLSDPDLVDLAAALADLARCLLAAGARELFPSIRGGPVLRGEGDLAALPAALPRATSNLMTIHLVGSCPMGEGDTPSATDSFGRVHGVPGLRCSDASLLCGPPGVNPQGTIMALARRNALQFLERR
jgi:choline dehydrogenase-like flavoprotein